MPGPNKVTEKGTIASGAGKRFSISNLFPSALREHACQSEQPCTSFPLLFKKKPKQPDFRISKRKQKYRPDLKGMIWAFFHMLQPLILRISNG